MKPIHLIALAALAFALGCSKTETLSSGGTVEADDPKVEQPVDAGTDDGGTSEVTPETKPDEPGTGTTAVKPADTKPVTGEAADNPGVTDKTLAGKYDGKMEFSKEALEMMKSIAPPDQREKIEQELKSAVIALDLKPSGEYSIATTSRGKTETQNGKWSYDKANGTVVLGSPELSAEMKARLKAQGATDEQIAAGLRRNMVCSVSEDGKTLTFTENQMGMSVTMTFVKK